MLLTFCVIHDNKIVQSNEFSTFFEISLHIIYVFVSKKKSFRGGRLSPIAYKLHCKYFSAPRRESRSFSVYFVEIQVLFELSEFCKTKRDKTFSTSCERPTTRTDHLLYRSTTVATGGDILCHAVYLQDLY